MIEEPSDIRKKWLAPTPILLFILFIIAPSILTLFVILSNSTSAYYDASEYIFRNLVNGFLLYVLPGAICFTIFTYIYSKTYKPLPKFDHHGNPIPATSSDNSKPTEPEPTSVPFSKGSIIRFSLIQSFTGCFMGPVFAIIVTIQTLGFGAVLFPVFLLSSIVFCLDPKWLPKTSYEFLLYRRTRIIGMILGLITGVLIGINSNAPIGEPSHGATGFTYYEDAAIITGILAILSIVINVIQTIVYKRIAEVANAKKQ